ncbi:copper transporter [Actinomyces faecalis]|uniref:copper transporter n=1 Tax=Actinomyces faecalis TaxID=2722820 RepID=UPI0015549B55|nr:copper transporter [Actinomyces faecalis]
MIDFRYHLVSLISVFLALAVGVVLGAGPLQNSLGNTLNDQVTSLREDRNATQGKLEQTETAVNERDEYITAVAAAYLPSSLTDRKVALVALPEADSSDLETVTAQLEAAGATVVARVSLTTAWVDTSRETFRSTYSGQFAGYMEGVTGTGNTVLGAGLATALTSSKEASAAALTDLLKASDSPLMTVDAEPSEPADSVVVVGPRTTMTTGEAPTPAPTEGMSLVAWNEALGGLASVTPCVVIGAADVKTDLVTQLRSSQTKVTTVDSVGQVAAAVSVPLALAHAQAGSSAAYGFDEGAEAVMPALAQAAASAEPAPTDAGNTDQ